MKKVINEAAATVTFTFTGLDPVVMHVDKLSDANRQYAVLHGMAARIGDNAAITKSAENNFTVTEAMRRAEVVAMTQFYEDAGNDCWDMRVAKRPVFNPSIQAIAEKRGTSYEEAAVWFNAKLMAEIDAIGA